MNRFSRIRHHVSIEDVKKKRLESIAVENFIKTEEEITKTISEKFKHNWREDFTNITTGNKVGQTFRHNPSGQTVTTSGVLGGIETIQTSVELFGDAIPGPDAKQYGLQGFAKPIDIMRRGKKKTEELNKELDSSEDYTKEIKADEFMKGRVEDSVDSALLSDLGYKSTEDILAEVGDVWTYEEYMAMMNAIGDKAAAKSLPITKKILEYSPTGKHPGDVPISLIDAQEAITIARQKAEDALARAWERYNKIPEPQDGFGGGQGNPTNRRGSGFDTQGALDSSGYGMDPSRDTETEARPTGLARVLTGIADLVTGNVADFDKRGNLKQAVMKAATKIPTLDRYQTPVNTMIRYDRFLNDMGKNKSNPNVKGATVNNRLDITNEISEKDVKYLESEMSKLSSKTSTDKILSFNNSLKALSKSNTSESDVNVAKETIKQEFSKIYLDKAGLVATFGGTGDPKTGANPALPEVLNVKETDGYYEVTMGKSYAFRPGGSEPDSKFLKFIGVEPDTIGSDTLSKYGAPIAAKLAITGDDKYFKKKGDPFSLYNSPDMHYKVRFKIKKKKKRKVNESNTFSKIKKFKNKY